MKQVLAFIIALAIGFGGGFFVAKSMGNNNGGSYDLEVLKEQVKEVFIEKHSEISCFHRYLQKFGLPQEHISVQWMDKFA